MLCWWAVLVPSGWFLFLPGVLDHFKYTDGLVGHALMAMAGFATSLLIFILVVLLGEDGEIFGAKWAFVLWQACTLGYVTIMLISGWIEGNSPMFATIVPGTGRNAIYGVRLLLGSLMTVASLGWFWRVSRFGLAESTKNTHRHESTRARPKPSPQLRRYDQASRIALASSLSVSCRLQRRFYRSIAGVRAAMDAHAYGRSPPSAADRVRILYRVLRVCSRRSLFVWLRVSH